jgi:basic membrane protein A
VRARVSRRALLRSLGGAALAGAIAPVAARADAPQLVALVHTQAAGDNGVVDGMIASLKRIGRERNLIVRAVYANDAANYQPILELLGEAQAAVILTTFNEMTQPLRAVAPAFPKTRFIQLYGDPMDPPIRNVRTVAYETHLAGYLSGVCGAMMSKESKLGYIGGISIPTLDANVNAQIAGAQSVRPGVEISAAFVGSFQDPAKALEIADQMFGSGIDYIQAEGSASDLGVIQSANAHAGRMVSGGSRPQFPLGPASVAAIELCDFGVSLYGQTAAALTPSWTPGHYRSGLQDGVVDFIPSPLFLAKGPPALVARFRDAWPQILAMKSKIVAGAIKVPFKTNLG